MENLRQNSLRKNVKEINGDLILMKDGKKRKLNKEIVGDKDVRKLEK